MSRGAARAKRGGEVFTVSQNQSTYMPPGMRPRLKNAGAPPLDQVEVQIAGYLGEEEIQGCRVPEIPSMTDKGNSEPALRHRCTRARPAWAGLRADAVFESQSAECSDVAWPQSPLIRRACEPGRDTGV